jgi:Tol biopolymer transport system component
MRKSVLLLVSVALAAVVACGVTLSVRTEPAQAAFPGTNGKIVFVEDDDEEFDYGIRLISPNGSGLTTLLNNAYDVSDPAFSPDGTRVAYARGRVNNREIYKINIANRTVTQITDNELYDADPTWNPDGTRIAFVRGERVRFSIQNTDIFVKRSDGTGKTVNLTNTPEEDEFAPAWSPNGKKIAFYTSATEDIVVLNLETGQRRNLTDDGTAHSDYNPNWSPDSTRIVFESYGYEERPGTYYDYVDRIYTMKASDGSDKQLLAEAWSDDLGDGEYLEGPTYSPDGEQVAYVKTAWDYVYSRPKLFKMNSSTGANKQLIYDAYNPGPGRYPYGDSVYLFSPDWGVKVQP